MDVQKLYASEAIVYGFKATYNNLRCAVYGMLIMLAEILGSFIVVSLPTIAFVMWKMPKVQSMAMEAGVSGAHDTAQAIVKEFTIAQVPLSVMIIGAIAVCTLFVLWAMFAAGYIRMILKFYDTNVGDLREMFMGWHHGPRLLFASIIYSVCVTLGMLLLIVPGIFILVRWSLYPFYIIDKNVGVFEAFKRSFNDVRGYDWQMLALVLLITLLNANTFFALLTIFPRFLMHVYAYRRLTT